MTPERANKIVDELRGTCKSIDDCLEDDEDAMDPALTYTIDNELFCCAVCEWWHDWDEQKADQDDTEQPTCETC